MHQMIDLRHQPPILAGRCWVPHKQVGQQLPPQSLEAGVWRVEDASPFVARWAPTERQVSGTRFRAVCARVGAQLPVHEFRPKAKPA
jgi:hypothetical protein